MRTLSRSALVCWGSFALACGASSGAAECPCKRTPSDAPAEPVEVAPEASVPPVDEAAPAPGAEPSSSGEPTRLPEGKRAPCTLGQDQTCNEDPAVSALWGRCTELGVCECKEGFERSPRSGLCRPAR